MMYAAFCFEEQLGLDNPYSIIVSKWAFPLTRKDRWGDSVTIEGQKQNVFRLVKLSKTSNRRNSRVPPSGDAPSAVAPVVFH